MYISSALPRPRGRRPRPPAPPPPRAPPRPRRTTETWLPDETSSRRPLSLLRASATLTVFIVGSSCTSQLYTTRPRCRLGDQAGHRGPDARRPARTLFARLTPGEKFA